MTRKLLPLLLIVLAACGGNGDDGSPSAADPASGGAAASTAQMVTSADGLVTLDIPAGAVPAGVEVTIEPAEPSEGSLVAYEFLPDGLVFSEPATVSVEVAMDESPIGEPVRLVRPAWLSSDGTEDDQIEFTVSSTEGGISVSGAIDHFSRFELLSGDVVTITQTSPAEFVELDSTFSVSFDVVPESDLDRAEIVTLSLPPSQTCSPAGPFRSALSLVEVELFEVDSEDQIGGGHILTSATTTCVATPDSTELTLSPIDGGGAPFPGPVLFRLDADGNLGFGFRLSQVPDGGTLGLGFEGADQMYFGQCNIERRGDEPSVCVVFDSGGRSTKSFPVVETIEGDTIWMSVPASFLDLIAGTMGEEKVSIGIITVDRYDNVGASQRSFLDLAELANLAGI